MGICESRVVMHGLCWIRRSKRVPAAQVVYGRLCAHSREKLLRIARRQCDRLRQRMLERPVAFGKSVHGRTRGIVRVYRQSHNHVWRQHRGNSHRYWLREGETGDYGMRIAWIELWPSHRKRRYLLSVWTEGVFRMLRRNQPWARLHPGYGYRILLPIMGSLQRFEIRYEVCNFIDGQV